MYFIISESYRKKSHDHINICREGIRQNSTPIHDKKKKKLLSKLGLRGKLSQLDKEYPQNPTANIILSSDKLKVFPLRSGTRKGYPSQHCFNILLNKVLHNTIRQEKETKVI